MIKTDNPELSRLILEYLAERYKIKQRRIGIHLSTLVYCLTKSFYDQQQRIEPTDEEVMLFSLGLGLQDELTPPEANRPVYQLDGIMYSPDFTLRLDEQLVELKTTRMSSKRPDMPETWLEYIMGGCTMMGTDSYQLVVLHMMGNYSPPFPTIVAYSLKFDRDELAANWLRLLERKQVYENALAAGTLPTPYTYCKDWECKLCRYKLQCTAITLLSKEKQNSG